MAPYIYSVLECIAGEGGCGLLAMQEDIILFLDLPQFKDIAIESECTFLNFGNYQSNHWNKLILDWIG